MDNEMQFGELLDEKTGAPGEPAGSPEAEAPAAEGAGAAPAQGVQAAGGEELSPEAAFAEEMMADRRPAEDLPIEELPLAEKPVRRAAASRPLGRGAKIAIAAAAVILLAGMLALTLWLGRDKSQPSDQGGQTAEESANAEAGEHSRVDMDEMMKYGPFAYTDTSRAEEYNARVVAKVGDHELTNGMLQIFYWAMVYQDLNENAEYLAYRGPDTARPFAEQKYGQVVNWEQHYLQTALDYYLQNIALYDEAVKNGAQISEETREQLENLPQSLAAQASDYGFESLDDYLAQSYGPAVSMDDLMEYYNISSLAFSYATQMQKDIAPTPEEISDFYDAHAEEYAAQGVEKTDQTAVSVRHILITPEQDTDSDGDGTNDASSEAAWESAEAKANAVYEEWKKDPTEENFAQLAGTYTEDPGSAQTGGLYENFIPGQMVEEFNDWCFDPARKPGDNGIVRTQYGYHLMYFSSESDRPYWQIVAEEECVYDSFNKVIDELFSRYEIKPDYENLHLFDAIAYNNAQNAAEGGE